MTESNEKIGFTYKDMKMEHYIRINKDVKEIETIISKERFYQLYKDDFNIKKRSK